MIPHTIKTNGHLKDPQTETSKITIWIIKDEVLSINKPQLNPQNNRSWSIPTDESSKNPKLKSQRAPSWSPEILKFKV